MGKKWNDLTQYPHLDALTAVYLNSGKSVEQLRAYGFDRPIFHKEHFDSLIMQGLLEFSGVGYALTPEGEKYYVQKTKELHSLPINKFIQKWFTLRE